MIYEIRLYTVVPGRMEDNHNRFENVLPSLMARHGIANVGRWTATAGPGAPTFVYMMAYPDLAVREQQWTSFYGDDDWWQARARTNDGEEMVERFDLHFLRPNSAWTPNVRRDGVRAEGVHELIFAEVALGRGGDAQVYLKETYLPLLAAQGGDVLMVADFISGTSLPRMAMIIAWPDASALHRGRRAIDGSSALRAVQQEERKRLGRTSVGRSDVYVLEPTPFNLPLASLGHEPWKG